MFYDTIALISHAGKLILKILQAKLQQYENWELPEIQTGFRKGRGARDQVANIPWIIEKSREFQKNIYFSFIDYTKAFDRVDHNKLENSSRDGNTRPPYLSPVATVRTRHGAMNWFKIGKGVHQGCILSPCLFNVYAEFIMQNAQLDEAQAGIKIARRNINNLRYADDTTLMAESEEELKSHLMKVKEESEKAGLKLSKVKIMASRPITSWQIDGETMETVTDFIILGSKITAESDCSHKIKRRLLLGRKAMTNLDCIKKQRHHFANKGPYSQSYGFSSSHVRMWELDPKEGWVPKNWCFWTVVLDKTLESPLGSQSAKHSYKPFYIY